MKIPVSHSSDPDLQKVPQALMRAAEKARKLHDERQATSGKVTQDVVRKPGAWRELPKAMVDWDSSNTNEDIARTLSGDGV